MNIISRHAEANDATRILRRLSAWILTIAVLAAGSVAHATVRCVATVNGGLDANDAGLMNAIDDANNGAEGSTWDIRLRYGTYQLAQSIVFLPDGDKDNKSLYLTGGWNSNCTSQTGDASNTIVRGIASTAQTAGLQFFFFGDNARFDIEGIRFENFSDFVVDDKPCYAFEICPDTDAIVVDHNEFDNGEQVRLVVFDAKKVVFRNNLVINMHPVKLLGSTVDFAPVGILIQNNEDPPQITFNTFADIECSGTPGGVMVQSQRPNTAIHHNIFQTTGCSKDLYIDDSYGGQPQTPYYNLLLSAGGASQGNLVDNGNVINFNPQFVDAFNGNYRLQNGSPAVNAGATVLGALQSGFVVSPLDLDLKIRPIGTRYDIGAYESNVNDGAPPVITVTSTNDVDDGTCNAAHCSLREAINLANSQVGSAQRIVFKSSLPCPSTILLSSPLPDITDPVAIDGYTVSGAAKNDLDLGSDASICILVGPAANIGYALRVPTGQPDGTRLTVQGLGFANSFYAFSGAAIELRAGNGHRIAGDVFGGYLPPGNNPNLLGSLVRAILVRGTATDVTIGGPDNGDRNYFGFMTQNGIVLNDATSTGHTIQNNYIGVQPNGLGVQANSASGISASGGSAVSIVDNAICASDNGIQLLGAATTKFTIQRNNIGVNAAGYGVATHANGIGIEIALGSSQHVIGAPPGANLQTGAYSNFIDNNNGPGVLVAANAGNYNSIRGNLIEANGRTGDGLGIDLGTAGPLDNDDGDPDTGPNLSENYPRIKGTTPGGGTQTLSMILNTNANQATRIDVYRSSSCPGGGRGANATTLVGSVDVNSGATGLVGFNAQVTRFDPPGYLTATATTNVGNTSELAPCVREDTVFADGYQTPGL